MKFKTKRASMQLSWFLAVTTFLAGATLMSINGEHAPASDAKAESHGASDKGKKAGDASHEGAPAGEASGKDAVAKSAEGAEGEHGALAEGSPESNKDARKPAAATEDFQEPSTFSNAEPPADGSLPSPTAIADVKKQREMLGRREKELESREEELKKKEQAIASELAKLEELRNGISRLDETRRKENEEKVAKLVETLETMSPKAASQLIAGIDEALAVSAITKMTTPKLAKIMNIMDPTKSSRLTELMSGVITSRKGANSGAGRGVASAPDSGSSAPKESLKPASNVSKNLPEKGGEKNDGKNSELSKSNAQQPVDSQSGAKGGETGRQPASGGSN